MITPGNIEMPTLQLWSDTMWLSPIWQIEAIILRNKVDDDDDDDDDPLVYFHSYGG